jgi:protein SCO1/2
VLGNSQGGTASLATFHGRVVVLTFLDSHCGQLCPVEASELGVVDRMLPADDRPEIVVVSVNPRDTPLTVRRFVQRARWTGPWVWMTGARGALQSVWKKFGIEVKQTRTAIDGITVTGVGHSSVIYVVDQEGFERTGYVAPFDARLVASDVLSLEHG